jgi:hypothetical protein
MIDIPPFPLAWPDNLPRNATPSGARPFSTTLNKGIENVRGSLRRFGTDTGKPIAENSIVFTSNYGGRGLEARSTSPKDAGVAVWFEWDKTLRCIAVDRYDDLAQNVQAIHHLIEADRTKMRYGGLEIVRAAFKGYVALPAPNRKPWSEVLGFLPASNFTRETIEAAYRERAKTAHPDRGGSREAWDELERAKREALEALVRL